MVSPLQELSGDNVAWNQPCIKSILRSENTVKNLRYLKVLREISVSISCSDKGITCCSHNGHKQGNEEGLQDFVFELYQKR